LVGAAMVEAVREEATAVAATAATAVAATAVAAMVVAAALQVGLMAVSEERQGGVVAGIAWWWKPQPTRVQAPQVARY